MTNNCTLLSCSSPNIASFPFSVPRPFLFPSISLIPLTLVPSLQPYSYSSTLFYPCFLSNLVPFPPNCSSSLLFLFHLCSLSYLVPTPPNCSFPLLFLFHPYSSSILAPIPPNFSFPFFSYSTSVSLPFLSLFHLFLGSCLMR